GAALEDFLQSTAKQIEEVAARSRASQRACSHAGEERVKPLRLHKVPIIADSPRVIVGKKRSHRLDHPRGAVSPHVQRMPGTVPEVGSNKDAVAGQRQRSKIRHKSRPSWVIEKIKLDV